MHNTRPNVVAIAKASSSKSKTVLKKKKWKRLVKHAMQSKPKVEKGNYHYCGVRALEEELQEVPRELEDQA
ncbi:hypothetical protein NL676_001893 [Syzygium grande]|nr:hypothetical protein NL676_001893 [Syzygium grande]